MATEQVRGAAGGYRQARRALQDLAHRTDAQALAAPRTGSPAPSGDSARAIPTGQILSITLSEARSGVRAQKVAEARARIAQGHYDQPEVRARLVNSLLRSFGELE